MVTNDFIQDGILYVPSKVAAKGVDLSADYISRMCREGIVLATWQQGQWYLNEKSLADVLATRRAKQEEIARAHSEQLKRERKECGLVIMQHTPLISGRAATAPHRWLRGIIAVLVMATITVLILSTSASALDRTTFAQLPSAFTETSSQIAAAATSFSNVATQKIRNFFCWWLDCDSAQIAQHQPQLAVISFEEGQAQSNSTTEREEIKAEVAISSSSAPQRIIETVIENVRTVIQSGIDAATLDARIAALDQDLSSRMNQLALARAYQTDRTIENIADATRIEELDGNVITGTISALIDTASAVITSLTATELVATNATTTNLYVSGSASLPTTSVSGDLTVSGTITGGTLSVAGLSSGGAISAPYFTATSTTATSTFDGAVGIGTTSPAAKLHVSGTGLTQFFLESSSDTAGLGPLMRFQRSRAAGGAVSSGDLLGAIKFQGIPSGSSAYVNASSIESFVDAAPTVSAVPSRLIFSTTNSGGSTSERMRIDGAGNVGIGSTTPWARLSVKGGGIGTGLAFAVSDSANTPRVVIQDNGNVGIGPTNPSSLFHVEGNWPTANIIGPVGDIVLRLADSASSATRKEFYITNDTTNNRVDIQAIQQGVAPRNITLNANGGNIGIGTTSPWRTLSVTGSVGLDGLAGSTGAGSLCLDANKQVVYNSASDACLSSTRATKHAIQSLELDALATIEALEPVSFIYNQGDNRTRFGFIAEDTAAVDPHLATYDASSTISGIDDRAILSVVVRAIKDLIHQVRDLATAVANLAERITTNRVETQELCVGSTCITETQLNALLSQPAAAALANPSPPNDPPVHEFATSSDPIVHESATSTEETNASSSPAIEAANNDHGPEEEPATPSEPANDNPLPLTEATGS